MENIEARGRNARRHTGSGLAGVRPEAIRLGPTDHQPNEAVPTRSTTLSTNLKPYTIFDQLNARARLVRSSDTSPLDRAKNHWTGR